MAKEEELKKVELKVSVDCCDGCKKKVLKALSIQGVLKIEIHPNLPKVTVVGNVDKEMLVKRLAKFGKVAAEAISLPDTNKEQQQQKKKNKQPQLHEERKKPDSDNQDGNCEKKSTKCTGGEVEKVQKRTDTSNEAINNANSTTADTTTTISAMATTALPHITYTMNPVAVHEAVMQQHGVYPMNWYPGNLNSSVIPMASFVQGAYQAPVAQPYCTCGCCYHQPPPVRSLLPRPTEYFNDDNVAGCHVM